MKSSYVGYNQDLIIKLLDEDLVTLEVNSNEYY